MQRVAGALRVSLRDFDHVYDGTRLIRPGEPGFTRGKVVGRFSSGPQLPNTCWVDPLAPGRVSGAARGFGFVASGCTGRGRRASPGRRAERPFAQRTARSSRLAGGERFDKKRLLRCVPTAPLG